MDFQIWIIFKMMKNLITIWRVKFLYFLIQRFSCYHARLRAGIFNYMNLYRVLSKSEIR